MQLPEANFWWAPRRDHTGRVEHGHDDGLAIARGRNSRQFDGSPSARKSDANFDGDSLSSVEASHDLEPVWCGLANAPRVCAPTLGVRVP